MLKMKRRLPQSWEGGWTCLLSVAGVVLLCCTWVSSFSCRALSRRHHHRSHFVVTGIQASSVTGEADKAKTFQQYYHASSFRNSSKNTKKYNIRQIFQRAKELERKGQWRKAISILKDILVLDPQDAHSYLALARLEAKRGSPKAEQAFVNGTNACPNSVHLWQAWAMYEETSGQVERARELFERALMLDSHNPYVYHAYGRMEHKLGRVTEARMQWEKALTFRSTAALVCSLGDLLISNKEYDKARDLYDRHVQLVPSEKERMEVYLASAWLEERYFDNFDRAEELIHRSLACNPTSSLAQVALARLEGRRGMWNEGKRATLATVRRLANTCVVAQKQSSKQQPADGRVFNAWASIEVKARKFGAARKILLKGLERYPNDHSLLQAAGKVEERMGNITGARALYGASLRIQPSAPSLVAYAMLDLRHPDSGAPNITKGTRIFEEALLLDPKHGPTYNAYAQAILQHCGDSTQVRRIFERGVRARCPDAASIYHGYARLELSLGNVDRARELLLTGCREAQSQDMGKDYPHRGRAVFLTHTLGMLEMNRNHPIDALKVFSDGINRYGNSSQLLLGAALCEISLGNEKKARALFERSVLSDERHAQAWQAWGVMEMRGGNLRSAKTLFECGIKSAPRHGALWQAYATMESRLGNVETARKLFETGVRKAPRHIPLYQSWAFMELREGNATAAKALIGQALTRDKTNGDGWLIAAEIEARLGNDGLANLLLRRGIECAPTKPELYRALGDSLVRKGKINEAREIYEQGIVVDQRHAPLYHSLAELEARIFNVDGLAKLHKRAAAIFNTNVMEPSPASSEILGTKIRASRSYRVPKGVAALAQRIVEDETSSYSSSDDSPGLSQDHATSDLLVEGVVRKFLTLEDDQ